MAHARTEFSDAQRAEIFVRDRATCCFSGANLWLPDAPLRPGYERDWVDHVRPSARGGRSEAANGVAACHTFNAKKRHNGADNVYLFNEGRPTARYFAIFGPLAEAQIARLQRMERLLPEDWYWNRAIGLVLLAFDQDWERDRYDAAPVRDSAYWFSAAYRKLALYQRLRGSSSLEARGVVDFPDAKQSVWLSLRAAESVEHMRIIVSPLYRKFVANANAWTDYFEDWTTVQEQRQALRRAERSTGLTDDTLECILNDHRLRAGDGAL